MFLSWFSVKSNVDWVKSVLICRLVDYSIDLTWILIVNLNADRKISPDNNEIEKVWKERKSSINKSEEKHYLVNHATIMIYLHSHFNHKALTSMKLIFLTKLCSLSSQKMAVEIDFSSPPMTSFQNTSKRLQPPKRNVS